jgi:hypothetical protein
MSRAHCMRKRPRRCVHSFHTAGRGFTHGCHPSHCCIVIKVPDTFIGAYIGRHCATNVFPVQTRIELTA